jgi:glycosyltransferase involved in cell wall biosynthesis
MSIAEGEVEGEQVPAENRSRSGGRRLHAGFPPSTAELPLVSVITAVFNARKYIAECIESISRQDYPHIEHIILDAGSTDGTIDVVRQYEDRIALWVSEPDHGVYDAWNKGLDLALGEWIAFLGADDYYWPGAISAYIELAHQNPEAEFLSSRAQLDHPSGYSPIFGGPWVWPGFTKRMTTVHVGSLHRRSLFDRYGKFDPSYRIAGDYEFLLRPRESLRAAFTPAVTVTMRAGGVSDSTAGLYEARRAKLATGVRGPVAAAVDLRLAVIRFHVRRLFLKASRIGGRAG